MQKDGFLLQGKTGKHFRVAEIGQGRSQNQSACGKRWRDMVLEWMSVGALEDYLEPLAGKSL